MPHFVATQDYFADADGNLVDGSDPNAAVLVARKGSLVAPDVAERHGIKGDEMNERQALEESEEMNRATVTPTNREAGTLVTGNAEIAQKGDEARQRIREAANEQRDQASREPTGEEKRAGTAGNRAK